MAWIKSFTELEDHHKTINMQLITGESRDEILGFLHRFWWRVLRSFPNGDVTGFSPKFMAETLGMKPERAEKRLQAMIDVGFIEKNGDKLFVHDWFEYSGRYFETNKKKVEKPNVSKLSTNHLQKIYKQNVEDLSLDKDIEKDKEKDQEIYGAKPQHPPTPFSFFLDAWNEKVGHLVPKITELTHSRQEKIRIRKKQDPEFHQKFQKCLEIITKTRFLQGENPRNWVITFDWLIDNDKNYRKVLEGNYRDTGKNTDTRQNKNTNAVAAFLEKELKGGRNDESCSIQSPETRAIAD